VVRRRDLENIEILAKIREKTRFFENSKKHEKLTSAAQDWDAP
jgi:hypothetical protein